jgi:hypothetical protein
MKRSLKADLKSCVARVKRASLKGEDAWLDEISRTLDSIQDLLNRSERKQKK